MAATGRDMLQAGAERLGLKLETLEPRLLLSATVVAEFASGGALVTVYDVNDPDTGPDAVQVKFSGDAVKSVKILGGDDGLAIVITGASSVGSIKDSRGGVPLAFLSSNAPIKSLNLSGGVTGYDPEALGGVGGAGDLVGILCEGGIGNVKLGGSLLGDLIAGGNVGKVKLGGNLGAVVDVDGALAGLAVGGDVLPGSCVIVDALLGKLQVKGDVDGGASLEEAVQILAGQIGKVQVGGETANCLLFGEELAALLEDGVLVHIPDVGELCVDFNVIDALIEAGLIAEDGSLDLTWLEENCDFIDWADITLPDVNVVDSLLDAGIINEDGTLDLDWLDGECPWGDLGNVLDDLDGVFIDAGILDGEGNLDLGWFIVNFEDLDFSGLDSLLDSLVDSLVLDGYLTEDGLLDVSWTQDYCRFMDYFDIDYIDVSALLDAGWLDSMFSGLFSGWFGNLLN